MDIFSIYLQPLWILFSFVIGTFIYFRWPGKTEYSSFFALVSFYFFVTAAVPWYICRSCPLSSWYQVNHWVLLASLFFGILHFILKPNVKGIYFWCATVAIAGSISIPLLLYGFAFLVMKF